MVNPLGAVPVWLSLSAGRSEHDKRIILRHVWRNMLLMLLAVLLFGTFILTFFGISLHAIRIAGAAMIIYNAFGLLRSNPKMSDRILEQDQSRDEISFAPLTMPMLVGPGTMAIILSYSNQLGYLWSSTTAATQYAYLLLSILLVAAASYFVLLYSGRLLRVLGNSGLAALGKIMGFLLLSIGAQMLIETSRTLWAG